MSIPHTTVKDLYGKKYSTYIPTHISHISFPQLQKKPKLELTSSFDIEENRKLEQIQQKKPKKMKTQPSFHTYVQIKLSNSVSELSTNDPFNLYMLEATNSLNLSKSTSINNKRLTKLKTISNRLPYLKSEPTEKEENYQFSTQKTQKNNDNAFTLPSFITNKTLENDRKKSQEILERKQKINSFALSIKQLENQKKKQKSKKPYVKTQEDLVRDAHFAVYELEKLGNTRNEIIKIEGSYSNNIKNFIKRQKKSQAQIRSYHHEKEIRFPLLFQKIFETSKEIKRPDNNFLLFSQTPYKKSIMRNVKQTLKIINKK